VNHVNHAGEMKMNQLTVNIIHLLFASILALGPLAIALYLDLKQEHAARQKRQ
jgi:hypothetical protein